MIGKNSAAAFESAIECARDPDVEALHPTGEGLTVLGFDDEMNGVRHHRKLDHTKQAARPLGECSTYGREAVASPQAA
jgi:hypothetical protein